MPFKQHFPRNFLFFSRRSHIFLCSGMVIQTIQEGTGASPLATDTVKASIRCCC